MLNLDTDAIFERDYRVIRRLSAGGMGAVYEVEQISTGKRRALKIMLPRLVEDPVQRKRFEQEARVGSLIASEHVVEVTAAGVHAESGTPWLVMELLEGETLGARIDADGPLRPSELGEFFEQLCHAVGQAHMAGIVHRDLKPENIFIAKSHLANAGSVLKVLDFGIAKITTEASSSTTDAMGSPLWMSPEQTERVGVTAAADVWALGLIAYYSLTGKTFWRAGNDQKMSIAQLMREIVFEEIPHPNERANEQGVSIPPEISDWLKQCLIRDPSRRFQNATVAWLALDEAIGGANRPLSKSVEPNAVLTPLDPSPFASTLPAPTTPPALLEARKVPRVLIIAPLLIITLVGVAFGMRSFTRGDPSASRVPPHSAATVQSATNVHVSAMPLATADASPALDKAVSPASSSSSNGVLLIGDQPNTMSTGASPPRP